MERYFGIELILAAPDVLISSARRRAQQRLVEVVQVDRAAGEALEQAELAGAAGFACVAGAGSAARGDSCTGTTGLCWLRCSCRFWA